MVDLVIMACRRLAAIVRRQPPHRTQARARPPGYDRRDCPSRQLF